MKGDDQSSNSQGAIFTGVSNGEYVVLSEGITRIKVGQKEGKHG
jgi:hypothetical protein